MPPTRCCSHNLSKQNGEQKVSDFARLYKKVAISPNRIAKFVNHRRIVIPKIEKLKGPT